MYIISDRDSELDELVTDLVYDKLSNDAFIVSVKDTEHSNFMDLSYLIPLFEYLGFWGPIDPGILNDINGNLLLGFFDKYLLEKDIDIEVISDQYIETTITAKYID